MTKKDYELIANGLRWARLQGIDTFGLVQYYAVEFAKLNPRFDRKKFLTACGVAE